MRRKEITAIILMILCTIGTVWAAFAYEASRQSPDRIILLARAPDKGNWSPRTMTIQKGRETTIEIRNVDVVSHGFYLPELDITVREVKAGEVEYVTITANEKGKFPFYCSVWCSDYHMNMRGELIVQ